MGSNRSSLGLRIASTLGFRIASSLGFRIASSLGFESPALFGFAASQLNGSSLSGMEESQLSGFESVGLWVRIAGLCGSKLRPMVFESQAPGFESNHRLLGSNYIYPNNLEMGHR